MFFRERQEFLILFYMNLPIACPSFRDVSYA